MKRLLVVTSMVICFGVLASPAQAGCNATQNCPSGGTVSCSGSSVCSVASNSVTCDGTPQTCPSCPSHLTCPSPPYSQPWTLGCSGPATSCSATSLTCGGQTQSCDACEASYASAPSSPWMWLCLY